MAFGLTAYLAGLDKFFNLLTNWEQYASPLALGMLPVSAGTLMRTRGKGAARQRGVRGEG